MATSPNSLLGSSASAPDFAGHDLVVDLLQGASCGQNVLRVVVGIEDDQLRRRRPNAYGNGDRDQAGRGETTEAVHLGASNSGRCGMRSVAQAMSRAFSQPDTKPSRP